MYDTILVPTDGSDESNVAIEYAIEEARNHGSTIHLLHVIQPVQSFDSSVGMGGGSVTSNVNMQRMSEEHSQEILNDARDKIPDDIDLVVSDPIVGTPKEKILEYSEEEDIDMIIMGSHGRTGIDRFLVGSVTEAVVRHSDIPVLTVTCESAEIEE